MTPTANTDAATKAYVDNNKGITQTTADGRYLLKSGGTMTGNIAMGNHKVSGLATPTASGDAASKEYVDAAIKGAGGLMCTVSTFTNSSDPSFTFGAFGKVNISFHTNSSKPTTITNYHMVSGGADITVHLQLDHDGSGLLTLKRNDSNSHVVTYIISDGYRESSQLVTSLIGSSGEEITFSDKCTIHILSVM